MRRSPELSKVISLARIARQRIEILARIENGPPHLQGYCGVAAQYIRLLAQRQGIHPDFVVGHFRSYNRILDEYHWRSGHAWVEFDGHIIDITATQFRNVVSKIDRDLSVKVYVCRSTNPHYFKEFSNEDALEKMPEWYTEPLEEICDKIERLAA